jgi:hypothetical protein
MAEENGSPGSAARFAGVRKPPRNNPYKDWYSANRDARRRTRLYQEEPSNPEGQGVVYVLRDAIGTVKVGYSGHLEKRLMDLQYQVSRDRSPVLLVRAVRMPLGMCTTVESRAHKLLKHCQVDYEWFKTSPAAACRAVNKAIEQIAKEKPYLAL